MQVNDRVRHSGQAIRPKRDYWLSLGDYARKERAKDSLDAYIAERGTVLELLPGDTSRGVSKGVRVQWDNGSESRCLPYMVETVEDDTLTTLLNAH